MMTNQRQVRKAFWEQHPDLPKGKKYKPLSWSENVYSTDTRCAFVDFVDMLARNGEISQALAQRVTL